MGREVAIAGAAVGRCRAGGGGTYTWFSPLGAKNHAATHMATTITKPMMTLQLRQVVLARDTWALGVMRQLFPYPLAMLRDGDDVPF